MRLSPDACYRALATRDARFDGRFYVGVGTTGIYCRPVCRARLARRERCRFFPSAASAEAAGFRPCLRCRPELAPGFAAVDAPGRLARAAVARIEDGFLEGRSLAALAASLGVSARHLRRAFESQLGVAPVAYAQTQRLLLAKRLLTDTRLPVTEIAFASGFASLRRMNALFRARYRMPPTRLRREGAAARRDGIALALAYRPPLRWDALLGFLGARAVAGVEACEGGRFLRALRLRHRGEEHAGWIEVGPDPRRPALQVRVAPSLARVIPQLLARVRHVFDLACDPAEVARALGPLAAGREGLRLPGAFDGFEAGVRAVVGQQVSVRAATTLLGRLAERFGAPLAGAPAPLAGAPAPLAGAPAPLARTFPDAATLAGARPAALAALGLPSGRARTLVALARAVADGLALVPGDDPEAAIARLEAIPGIGPWTAHYVALRGLGWPDAFLPGDLVVRRALGGASPARALARAEAWRPWRGYAVIHLWEGRATA